MVPRVPMVLMVPRVPLAPRVQPVLLVQLDPQESHIHLLPNQNPVSFVMKPLVQITRTPMMN